jgi:sugar phosphate isomerase/epimerase
MIAGASTLFAEERKPCRLGLVIHSYDLRRSDSRKAKEEPAFDDPLAFLAHARKVGADGIQLGIGRRDKDYTAKLRKAAEEAGMHVEGMIRLPDDKQDTERFSAEIESAKDAGARLVRCACLTGRRYEVFETARAFEDASKKAYERLGLAEPLLAKHDVGLAVENHKDWRADQLVELLKRVSSKHVGVCVDTGNSIALLEAPLAVVETLAPFALTTHLKDMAVAEYEEGFLLAEVPFGAGFLDMKKMIEALRKHRPDVPLNLEMITRDPLKVPCLTGKYWATFETLPGRHLAEALARVRKHAAKKLPQLSALPRARQIEIEEENVGKCLQYARERLGL